VTPTERFQLLVAEGSSRDAALAELRRNRATPFQCIAAVAESENIGPGEAKRVVAESPAWTDYFRRNDEQLIEEIEGMK
jgi:hypothetical protein